jgi:hypothetical protein
MTSSGIILLLLGLAVLGSVLFLEWPGPTDVEEEEHAVVETETPEAYEQAAAKEHHTTTAELKEDERMESHG